jgi:hypothetical protein
VITGVADRRRDPVTAGQTADGRYAAAVPDAEHAYALLQDGLGDLTPMR